MSEYYLASIIILSPFFIKEDNLIAVYIFTGAAILFWMPLGSIPYKYLTVYLLIAATIDLTVMTLLSLFSNPTYFILKIQRICLAFIVLDSITWIGFMLDYSPTESYNFLCSVLYALVLLVVLTGKNNHVRTNRMDNWRPQLLWDNYQGNCIMQTNQEKAGN